MIKSIAEKIKKAKDLGFSQTEVILSNKIRKKLNMLPKVPPTVYVELTNQCNLKCVMCDRGSLARQELSMGIDLFRHIMKNLSDIGVPEVKLNRFGEPLLQPKLLEMISFAKYCNIPRVYFTTNGTLLTDELSRALILSGLDSITFSVDGANAETYENIRRGASYQKVVNNIETFARIRKNLGLSKPQIVLNTLLMKETSDQMALVFDKWSSKVDKINVIPVGRYGNIEDYSAIDRNTFKLERRICHQPFDRLLVFWDGSVTVCCADINGDLCVGNVKDERLEDIWTNGAIRAIRRKLTDKNYTGMPLCAQCDSTNLFLYQEMQRARKSIYELYGPTADCKR